MLDSGAKSFEDAAHEFSTCPSRNEGAHPGHFKPE